MESMFGRAECIVLVIVQARSTPALVVWPLSYIKHQQLCVLLHLFLIINVIHTYTHNRGQTTKSWEILCFQLEAGLHCLCNQ